MPENNERIKFYTTIEKEGHAELTERKSIFIGHAARVTSEAEAMEFIRKIKEKYHDAKHNCYAYSILSGTYARYSDDGEPQGTAGMPILGVIKKSGCDDCAIAVTRYFGGILLGAGGLVRAYSAAASMALDEAHIVTYEEFTVYSLSCSYSEYNKILFELENAGAKTEKCDFLENVCIEFAVKTPNAKTLTDKISEMSGGKLVPQFLYTKFGC